MVRVQFSSIQLQIPMTAFLISGTETKIVPATAVRAIAMAANGNASTSETMLDTPKPWAALPTANPRVMGSWMLTRSNNFRPYWAPMMPVRTTTTTAMEMSPPSIVVTGMARAVVMLRASMDKRIIRAFPEAPPRRIRLVKAAVPKMVPKLETKIAATTILKFSSMIVLRLYMLTAKLTTDGPRQNRSRSPAPAECHARLLFL
mmetsp:Transcript_2966/g.6390  ORF Transcript_2966/g.6390 Transcript_2966/m.6390 type:complete len:203 (-) Transcript_2966:1117-1725(-)